MRSLGIAIAAALVVGGAALGYVGGFIPGEVPKPRPIEPTAPPSSSLSEERTAPGPRQPATQPGDWIDSGPPDAMPKWNGKSFWKDVKDRRLTRLEGMPYAKARLRLKALGYQPVIFTCRDDKAMCGEIGLPLRKKFPEVHDCTGGGRAFCDYGWMNAGTGAYLLVSAEGHHVEGEGPILAGFQSVSWDEVAKGQGRLLSPTSTRPPLPPQT